MQLKYFAVTFLVAAAGCDDVHTGQPSDPGGPVKLMRIMVQDSQPFGARGVAMDLLDVPGSLLSTATTCNDATPCATQFVLGGVNPDFSCTAGVCNDPLRAGDAPLIPPVTGAPGEAGGTQLRFVFNKLLPSTIAADSVVEIDDAAGAKVAGTAIWDPTGSPTTTSDPIRVPFGPALVWKPAAPLSAHAQYTIKLNAALVTDRAGNGMADQNGVLITGTFTKAFTTEALAMIAASTVTDVTAAGVSLTPDEILTLGFNAPVWASTVSCSASTGAATVAVRAFSEAGSNPADCTAVDETVLNLVAADAAGAAIDWVPGSYTITCTGQGVGGTSTLNVTGGFTVAGTAQSGDTQARSNHAICN